MDMFSTAVCQTSSSKSHVPRYNYSQHVSTPKSALFGISCIYGRVEEVGVQVCHHSPSKSGEFGTHHNQIN